MATNLSLALILYTVYLISSVRRSGVTGAGAGGCPSRMIFVLLVGSEVSHVR